MGGNVVLAVRRIMGHIGVSVCYGERNFVNIFVGVTTALNEPLVVFSAV
jgi:hypothetical protein